MYCGKVEPRGECIGLNNSLRATQPRRCDANTNEKQQLKVSPFSCILYTTTQPASCPALLYSYFMFVTFTALLCSIGLVIKIKQ